MRIKQRPPSPLKLLSNPVAYRIVAALGARGAQNTETLGKMLNDVPGSTLYRQTAQLRAAGMIQVVSERQARGAIERTYAIASREAAALTPELVANAPLAQLRAAIRNFIAAMAADITTHIDTRRFARSRGRLHAALYVAELTDEEYLQALQEIARAIRDAKMRSQGRDGRKRHAFYLIAKPEDQP